LNIKDNNFIVISKKITWLAAIGFAARLVVALFFV